MAWRTSIEVESCALFGSRVGGSFVRSILRTWLSARFAAADADALGDSADPEALADAPAEPLGVSALAPALAAVLAAALGAATLGALEAVEVPQAAATIATVPRIPNSRFFKNI